MDYNCIDVSESDSVTNIRRGRTNVIHEPPTAIHKRRHARLGEQIYERDVRPKVEAANRGKFVAIDVDTGEYEVADDVLTAQTLLKRLPDAQIWCVRIGYSVVHRFGPRSLQAQA